MIGQCIEWEGKMPPPSERDVRFEVHRIEGALRHHSPFGQEKPLHPQRGSH